MAQPPPGWNFPGFIPSQSSTSWAIQGTQQSWNTHAVPPGQITQQQAWGTYSVPNMTGGQRAPSAPSAPFMSYAPPTHMPPAYSAMNVPPQMATRNPKASGLPSWVIARNGNLPAGAVSGGYDNGQLYVGRAKHKGALLPGKVQPAHGVCYVAWGGKEHAKKAYQVLCGCDVSWVAAARGEIPQGALPAGETENGEPLFVGRVQHKGTMTIGKIQESHHVCYIPYGGKEIAFKEYEVLLVR